MDGLPSTLRDLHLGPLLAESTQLLPHQLTRKDCTQVMQVARRAQAVVAHACSLTPLMAPLTRGSPTTRTPSFGIAAMAPGNHAPSCRRMRPHAPLDLSNFFAGSGNPCAARMHGHRHRTERVGDCIPKHDLIAAIQHRGNDGATDRRRSPHRLPDSYVRLGLILGT